MKLLRPSEVIDGFEIEECVHAGGLAHIYKMGCAHAANGTRREPEFPMTMEILRMTAGDGAENIISYEIEHQIMPTLTGLQMQRLVATVPMKVVMEAPCTVILVKPNLPFEQLAIARGLRAAPQSVHDRNERLASLRCTHPGPGDGCFDRSGPVARRPFAGT